MHAYHFPKSLLGLCHRNVQSISGLTLLKGSGLVIKASLNEKKIYLGVDFERFEESIGGAPGCNCFERDTISDIISIKEAPK
jgi:hypothetical protein